MQARVLKQGVRLSMSSNRPPNASCSTTFVIEDRLQLVEAGAYSRTDAVNVHLDRRMQYREIDHSAM